MEHYSMWGVTVLWFFLYGIIILFIPFHRKCRIKPQGLYLGFAAAFALEMFGIPFSLFIVDWAFGIILPEGFLWGHTLINYIGFGGMYLGILLMLSGLIMIMSGWKKIYQDYWSREKGEGRLVQEGIYRLIRHPQYTGLFLITLGMMAEWVTLPLLILWPVLWWNYRRLAKMEEEEMEREFGSEYLRYKETSGMFLPRWFPDR